MSIKIGFVAAVICSLMAGCAAPAGNLANPSSVQVKDANGKLISLSNTQRLVTIGGTVTEIVYALGAGAQVVATDTSSSYPAAATALPKAGYQRRLSAEGILALGPSAVFATTDAGPPEAIKQISDAGVPVLVLQEDSNIESTRSLIRGFGTALGKQSAAENLIVEIEQDLKKLQTPANKAKVLFIYARSTGAPTVAGKKTSADNIITLAGGQNAISEFEGFKPLTAEWLAKTAPEVILLSDKGLEGAGGVEGVLKLPGVALTPAGQQRRIVALDEVYLLSFGPRVGKAAADLAKLIQPTQK